MTRPTRPPEASDCPSGGLNCRPGSADPDPKGVRAIIPMLRMTMRALQGHSRAVERHCGINASQLWALWEIHRAGELRANDLARRLAVHASTVSNLLERLETAGLVERLRSRDDQRVVLVRATDSGVALLERSPVPPQGLLLAALEAQSDDENRALRDALAGLVQRLPQAFDGVARVPFDGREISAGGSDNGSAAACWPPTTLQPASDMVRRERSQSARAEGGK